MGQSTRPGGGGNVITTFWPDDTSNKIYRTDNDESLKSILDAAKEKWPGIKTDEMMIGAERIHTDCIYYDLYDPSDYTNFITITASEEYFKRTGKSKEEKKDQELVTA